MTKEEISKWIRNEAAKTGTDELFQSSFIEGGQKIANLLLPQLQAQQEEIKQLKEEMNKTAALVAGSAVRRQAAEIESLKKQNERQAQMIQEFMDGSVQYAKEIESLKRENERLRAALTDVKNWDEDMDYKWGDPGSRAMAALNPEILNPKP